MPTPIARLTRYVEAHPDLPGFSVDVGLRLSDIRDVLAMVPAEPVIGTCSTCVSFHPHGRCDHRDAPTDPRSVCAVWEIA